MELRQVSAFFSTCSFNPFEVGLYTYSNTFFHALWFTGTTSGGVWYTLKGTGNTVLLGVNSTFDSQISLFSSAENCNELVCIDGNDQSTIFGYSSSLHFNSTVGEQYFILVHGYDPSVGDFELSVQEVLPPENDSCSNAAEIKVGEVTTGNIVTATQSDDFVFQECGSSRGGNQTSGGVWFTVSDQTSQKKLEASVVANYDMQLTLFSISSEEEDCSTLMCITGTDGDEPNFTSGSIQWNVIAGQEYKLYVHGYNGNVGDFELSLKQLELPADTNMDTVHNL